MKYFLAFLFVLICSSAQAASNPPNCPSNGGSQALNYTTSNNAFTCNLVSGGSASSALGSATTTNPYINGDLSSGLYTSSTGTIDLGISGTKIQEWNSSGTSITGTTTGTFSGNVTGNLNGLITSNLNANFNNLSSGFFVDPRDPKYGANTCTGFYGVGTTSVGSGGSSYAVNDTFSLAAPLVGARGMTGHVTGVSGGVVTSYTVDNPGSGYTGGLPHTYAATTLTGGGSGLTILVSSNNATGNDDGVAFRNAALDAVAIGAALLVPNGCWISTFTTPTGLTMLGANWGVDYGFNYQLAGLPKIFVIDSPSFVINFGTSYNVALANFEVDGFASGGGPSTCVGSASTTGGFNGSKNWLYGMSLKGCNQNLGNSAGGQGAQLYVVLNSDLGASNFGGQVAGMYGAFSDTYVEGNTFAAGGGGAGIVCAGCQGFLRILNNRFEFQATGITGDSGIGNSLILGNQFDHHGTCQLKLNGGYTALIVNSNTFKGGGLAGSLYVTGAADNGAGLIRLTVRSNYPSLSGGTDTGGISTGDVVKVSSVGGTTEANATWTLNKIDATHIDLQGSTFTNAYTSGGFASVRGKDADICLNGTAGRDVHFDGNNFTNSQTSFTNYPSPAFVVESTTSGANNDWISFSNGMAHTAGSNTFTSLYDPWNGYSVGFFNWVSGAPTHLSITGVAGTPAFSNDQSLGYSVSNGALGLITTNPTAGSILDMSLAQSTTNSSIVLPNGSNGNRPSAPVTAMFRYNTSSNLPEFYNGASWLTISSFPVIYGAFGGLTLANDGGSPNDTVDIAAGAAASSDGTVTMSLGSAITKTTAAWAVGSGNGCLDTGAVANSTWYHLFIIERLDTTVVDILCSTSPTTPTLPTNYTVSRRIGSVKTDGSSHIIAFTQVGSTYYWATATLDINTAALGTSAALQTLNVPPGVNVTPLCRYTMSKDGNSVILTSGDETDVAPTTANPIAAAPGADTIDTTIAAGVVNTACPFLTTNTASQIRARASAASTTLSIVTRGWID